MGLVSLFFLTLLVLSAVSGFCVLSVSVLATNMALNLPKRRKLGRRN